MWTAVVLARVPTELQRFVDSVSTTEARAVATAAVVLVALGLAFVVAPYVIGLAGRLLARLTPGGRAGDTAGLVNDYIPTTVSAVVLRVVQVGLLTAAGITLLAVWGLVGLALDILRFLGLSLPLLTKLATTAVLFLLAYVAVDVFEESVARYSRGADRITEHQEEVVYRVGNLAIIAVVVATALTVWGINLSGLLVGAGFLGIVVGLAARQTLGSLIAGLVLMFARPFTIGDWVEVGDQEGIVTKITVFNTRLENFDGESIVIPNDRVSDSAVVNRSERGRLRIRVDVGVDYEVDPERAQDVALDAIDDVDAVAPTPPPQAIPKAFGDSAVVIELRFWIDRPTPQQKWRATSSVVRAVKRAYDEEGIKIPFPQRELTGRAETGGFRVRGGDGEAVDRDLGRSPAAEPDGGEQ
jgi:small-conductance mechanosensitive channel